MVKMKIAYVGDFLNHGKSLNTRMHFAATSDLFGQLKETP